VTLRVQIDTEPGGRPPFLIEADQRLQTSDPTHAATTIYAWLTGKPTTSDDT
jgi:hypothetical protein